MSYPPEPPPSGPGYGPAYGSGYGPGYGPMPISPTNGKATAALVTGIASLVLSWCCGLGVVGVVAIVLGVRARAEIRASGGRQQGDGLALGGIVTGSVAVVLGLLILVLIGVALAGNFTFETHGSSGTSL